MCSKLGVESDERFSQFHCPLPSQIARDNAGSFIEDLVAVVVAETGFTILEILHGNSNCDLNDKWKMENPFSSKRLNFPLHVLFITFNGSVLFQIVLENFALGSCNFALGSLDDTPCEHL